MTMASSSSVSHFYSPSSSEKNRVSAVPTDLLHLHLNLVGCDVKTLITLHPVKDERFKSLELALVETFTRSPLTRRWPDRDSQTL